MSNKSTSLKVCMQNFRKWKNSYQIWVAFILIFIVESYNTSWFVEFADGLGSNVKIAPWVFVFSVSSAFTFSGILLFFPVILLFCNAPFIDGNQMFVLARCSRKKWTVGQLLYIMFASLAYVLASFVMSLVVLIGRLELTSGWGTVINTAAKAENISGARSTGVPKEIVYYFSPQTALFYTLLLFWLASFFIGLVTYVVNTISKNAVFGVFVSFAFVIWNFVQCFMFYAEGSGKFDWLLWLSPISWCSLQNIYVSGDRRLPSIQYVLAGYFILISLLIGIAYFYSRKQEIYANEEID